MKLSEFSSVSIGHTFRSRLVHDPDGDVSVIQPKNISSDGFLVFGPNEPLRTKAKGARAVRAGDVLVVNRGRFAAAVFDLPGSDKWIAPSSLLILSVRKESVLPEYVACYLNSASGQKLYKRHFEETTIPYISTGNLVSFDIPIPPLEKQKALIAFERTAREFVRLTNRKQELYRQILDHEIVPENKERRI